MFYDKYVQICNRFNVSPSRAALDAGMSNSTVTKSKNTPDAEPTGAAIKKLCDYFHISVSELLGEEEQKEKPLVNGDEELTEYLEMLKTRPEMRMLFQISKDATKEDVEAAVRVIEAIRKK